MQQDHATQPFDNEIDLRELFLVLWAGKKIVFAITSVSAIIAIVIALSIPNQYKATATIAPAQSGDSSMLGGMASQFGGLASLAGISIPSGDGGDAQIAIEVMQSWAFIQQFIQRNDLSVEVFAANGWNRGNNQLSIDSSLYDEKDRRWLRSPSASKTVAPTSWELYKAFSNRLSVSRDKATGMMTVSIEYYSPIVAQKWLGLYIDAINEHMRDRRLAQSNRNIDYLEKQINKTSLADMKEVFYQIIEEQIKSKMLAEASPEYAFVTVSPAMVPEEKSSPKRALICILATMLGGIASICIVLLTHYLKQPST